MYYILSSDATSRCAGRDSVSCGLDSAAATQQLPNELVSILYTSQLSTHSSSEVGQAVSRPPVSHSSRFTASLADSHTPSLILANQST